MYGREAQIRHAGFGPDSVAQGLELMSLDHQVTRTGTGYEELRVAADGYQGADWYRAINPDLETPLPADAPYRLWERAILDFDPQPLLDTITSPVLWVFGDPDLDRFSPVNLSLNRVEQAKASGMPYDIIQIEHVGHTLELEGDRDMQTLLQVRVPLIWRMFRWLNVHV
jgi:pimeloyl-ACP methyl ester carboxylesterase